MREKYTLEDLSALIEASAQYRKVGISEQAEHLATALGVSELYVSPDIDAKEKIDASQYGQALLHAFEQKSSFSEEESSLDENNSLESVVGTDVSSEETALTVRGETSLAREHMSALVSSGKKVFGGSVRGLVGLLPYEFTEAIAKRFGEDGNSYIIRSTVFEGTAAVGTAIYTGITYGLSSWIPYVTAGTIAASVVVRSVSSTDINNSLRLGSILTSIPYWGLRVPYSIGRGILRRVRALGEVAADTYASQSSALLSRKIEDLEKKREQSLETLRDFQRKMGPLPPLKFKTGCGGEGERKNVQYKEMSTCVYAFKGFFSRHDFVREYPKSLQNALGRRNLRKILRQVRRSKQLDKRYNKLVRSRDDL